MRSSRFGRSLATLILLSGCSPPDGSLSASHVAAGPAQMAEEVDARCAPYVTLPDAHAWCVVIEASQVAQRKVAMQACLGAGARSGECRSRWVERAMLERNVTDRDGLLEVCTDDDCRLKVLDHLPATDPLAQLSLCLRAGAYARDCAGHHLRGYVGRVDAAWLDRLSTSTDLDPVTLGQWLGTYVVCGDVAWACAGPGRVTCERLVSDPASRATVCGPNPVPAGGAPPLTPQR